MRKGGSGSHSARRSYLREIEWWVWTILFQSAVALGAPKRSTHRESLRSKSLPRAKRSSSVDRPWPGYADMVTIRRNRVGDISHAHSFLCSRKEAPQLTSRDGLLSAHSPAPVTTLASQAYTGTFESRLVWTRTKSLMKVFWPRPTIASAPSTFLPSRNTQGERVKPNHKMPVRHNN